MEHKFCHKCNTTKEVTNFYRNKHHSDGLGNWCKPCENVYRKDRYHKRKQSVLQTTESKICVVCNQSKLVSHFHTNFDKIDCYDIQCKACSRDRLRTPSGKKRRMCYTAKQRAKTLNLPFNLLPVDFDMPTHCPILGIELCMTHAPGGPKDDAPSLDRIIPTLGYVKGNVVVISQRANRIKNDSSLEELKKVVDFLTQLEETNNKSDNSGN